MAMDKYGVEQVRRVQQGALDDVRAKLGAMRSQGHEKTAEEAAQVAELERQERELVEALRDSE